MGANIFLKITFIGVQVVFIIFGIILIALGAWVEVQDETFRSLIDNQEFVFGAYLCIAVGCAIILVAGIGMVGALCETKINKFLLGFYIILIFIIFLAQLVGGILAFVYRAEAGSIVREGLNDTLVIYGTNTSEGNAATEAWDEIQERFECCGISGVSDWIDIPGILQQGLVYPMSCCINITNINCGEIEGLNTNSFTQGCEDAITDIISSNLIVIAAIAISFLVGQILVILMTICLLCFTDFDD